MKVAICFSGIIEEGNKEYSKSVETIKDYFGYDCFFGTWEGRYTPKEYNVWKFQEPEMHYHPGYEFVSPTPKNYRWKNNTPRRKGMMDKFYHRTKQILIHSYMLRKIPLEYDMIIRVRFDNVIDTKRQTYKILNESYENKRAIGFHVPKGKNNQHLDALVRLPKNSPRQLEHLVDHMIIHPRSLFDSDYVESLHHDKKLLPAEWGWYQALSENNGDNHQSILGFCGVTKTS